MRRSWVRFLMINKEARLQEVAVSRWIVEQSKQFNFLLQVLL